MASAAPPTPAPGNNSPPAPTAMPSTTASPPRLSFQFAQLRPASESAPALTPPAETAQRSGWLDVASAPASARTSFTRVDQTRAGTPSADDEDSAPASATEHLEGGGHAQEPTAVEVREEPTAVEVREVPTAVEVREVPTTPQAALTFLLVTGRRRTMAFDPETTVGRVKELVWNTWPSGVCFHRLHHRVKLTGENIADWNDTERPPAPAYLRILYLGKVLQDDETLSRTFLSSSRPLPRQFPHPTHTLPTPQSLTSQHMLPPPSARPRPRRSSTSPSGPPTPRRPTPTRSRRRSRAGARGQVPAEEELPGRRLFLDRPTMRRCVLRLWSRGFVLTYCFL
jgi:hypothetical protein